MTPMITVMASIVPKHEEQLLLAVLGIRIEDWHGASLASQHSSSIVRSRPARIPTTICGTIRPAISAIGSPQPPLCW